MSAPYEPGASRMASEVGSTTATSWAPRGVRGIGELAHRLELAVEVRLRDHEAGDVVAERRGADVRVGRARPALGEIDRDGHDLDSRARSSTSRGRAGSRG